MVMKTLRLVENHQILESYNDNTPEKTSWTAAMKTFVTVIATDYQTYNVNGDRAWRTFKDFMLRLLAALDEKATEHGPNASDIEISGQKRWNLYCVAPKVPQRTYTGSGKANSRNIS